MNTEYKLPDGVRESWFLMTATGDGYDTRICSGAELVLVWAEMCFGSLDNANGDELAKWVEQIANRGNWWESAGVCNGIEYQMEDGSITFHLIRDYPDRVKVQHNLISLARAAWHAVGNSEEIEYGDSRGHVMGGDNFDALSDALDALDELPELPAPYTGTGPAKAEHALGLRGADGATKGTE